MLGDQVSLASLLARGQIFEDVPGGARLLLSHSRSEDLKWRLLWDSPFELFLPASDVLDHSLVAVLHAPLLSNLRLGRAYDLSPSHWFNLNLLGGIKVPLIEYIGLLFRSVR